MYKPLGRSQVNEVLLPPSAAELNAMNRVFPLAPNPAH